MPKRDPSNLPWPELLKPATAAAMLDLSESTFRAAWPILAARHGLQVIGFSGPKFLRVNVLDVITHLADKGLDIRVDHARRMVCVGDDEYPIRSSRSGKTGRGRPTKKTA